MLTSLSRILDRVPGSSEPRAPRSPSSSTFSRSPGSFAPAFKKYRKPRALLPRFAVELGPSNLDFARPDPLKAAPGVDFRGRNGRFFDGLHVRACAHRNMLDLHETPLKLSRNARARLRTTCEKQSKHALTAVRTGISALNTLEQRSGSVSGSLREGPDASRSVPGTS